MTSFYPIDANEVLFLKIILLTISLSTYYSHTHLRVTSKVSTYTWLYYFQLFVAYGSDQHARARPKHLGCAIRWLRCIHRNEDNLSCHKIASKKVTNRTRPLKLKGKTSLVIRVEGEGGISNMSILI